MDVEIPVLAGHLNVATQSGFSINRISKKKPNNKYCLLFKASRHGIERLEIGESKEDKNPKIITLENCVKITQEPSPANLITVITKSGSITLNTPTDDDQKEWLNALQMVAFRDKSGVGHTMHAAIEEDNDLYCSSYGDGLFIVTLIPSDTSIRCQIEPRTYMLYLTTTELQLKSAEDINVCIAKWPYRFIRKYGYRDGKFTFEAGRKCSTGEGVFTLDHTNPQEVFRCMSAKMKSMKKLISGGGGGGGDSLQDSTSNSENQLCVAAAMEAGSRSPLPPSPNQNCSEFEINSTPSVMSLRGFLSSSDSLNNFSTSTTASASLLLVNSSCPAAAAAASLKHIPAKPPRKPPSSLDKLVTVSPSPATSLLNSPTHVPEGGGKHIAAAPLPLTPNTPTQTTNCDKVKKFLNYEPVSISQSPDPNKIVGSTVILKPTGSPEAPRKVPSTSTSSSVSAASGNQNTPPHLPHRNADPSKASLATEREYESIETITNAWRTLGLGEVRHTERLACDASASASAVPESGDHAPDFLWLNGPAGGGGATTHKTCPMKESLPQVSGTTKIIDIDIGEGTGQLSSPGPTDLTYDRLDFLAPNHCTSSGYKTIVNVSSGGHTRFRCSSPPPANDYELIAGAAEIQACRKADDSHLGYGILRKSLSSGDKAAAAAAAPAPPQISLAKLDVPLLKTTAAITASSGQKQASPLDPGRSYNGIYTIVSKPKRV